MIKAEFSRTFGQIMALMITTTAAAGTPWKTLDGKQPIIIAHRGAPGYLPDHTLEGYERAINMGADFIEPDLVSTRDGVLVARHEPNITNTTNVAEHPEFASRKTTRTIDGVTETGWFTIDFTFAELRTLGAVQPRADRDPQYNGKFLIPSFDEIIALAKRRSVHGGRTVGIYPETKHPTWHCQQGMPLEPKLLDTLRRAGWTQRKSPVVIQSFEAGNLRYLRGKTKLRLIQLLDSAGFAADGTMLPPTVWQAGTQRCALYSMQQPPTDFTRPESFAEVAQYADGLGPWKRFIVGVKSDQPGSALAEPTRFIEMAHAAKLFVHAYTFRSEEKELAPDYGGDPAREYAQFFAIGLDGLFSDFTDTAVAARARAAQKPATGN